MGGKERRGLGGVCMICLREIFDIFQGPRSARSRTAGEGGRGVECATAMLFAEAVEVCCSVYMLNSVRILVAVILPFPPCMLCSRINVHIRIDCVVGCATHVSIRYSPVSLVDDVAPSKRHLRCCLYCCYLLSTCSTRVRGKAP